MSSKIRQLAMPFPKYTLQVIYAALGLILILIFMHSSAVSVSGQGLDYTVGAGDTLYISVWGNEKLSGSVTVGPDGTIMLQQPIGTVYVNDMTAAEIAELLTMKVGEYIIDPVLSVSIRSFEGFIVHVLGQVMIPSFYQIPEGTSLQEVITQAGGFTELADPRSIILHRKTEEGVEELNINFSQFLEQNDMASNPILEVDDRIVVPRMSMDEKLGRLVTVVGEVAKSGSYDLDIPMSLIDVLGIAGGTLRSADLSNIVIYNRSGKGKDAFRQVDMGAILSEAEDSVVSMPMVAPGEAVIVSTFVPIEERTFPVNVAGEVVKEGSYPVVEGMRMMDAIFLAGGFAEEASIENIILIHAEQDDSEGQSEVIISSFSLKEYLTVGDVKANPVLRERDTIIVPAIETAKTISPVQTAFSTSISVSVIGAVTKPGTYQMPTESNLLSALALAGGPSKDADLKRTMLIRAESSEARQRLLIDLEEIVVEGNLELLPYLSSGDTVLILEKREKRDWWRGMMSVIRDTTVIVTLIWYFVRISS